MDTISPGQGIKTAGRFSTLPARAYADVRLKPGDIHVFGVLAMTENVDSVLRREGWFQISQGLIAVLSGVSRTTVNRSVARLRDAGYLVVQDGENENGGSAACLYKIVYDADLAEEYDRWRGAEPKKAPPVKKQDTAENLGVENVNTPETLGVNAGHTAPVNNVNTADIQGVSEKHTPVNNHNTPENIGVQEGLESTSLHSDEFEFDAADRIVTAFKDARLTSYPDTIGGICADVTLRKQAEEYLNAGISEAALITLLTSQISISASRGIEPPAGITRYKRDIARIISPQPTLGPQSTFGPRSASSSRPATRSSKPACDERWVRVAELVSEGSSLSPWIGALSYQAFSDGVLRVKAPTTMIQRAVEPLIDDLVLAASKAFECDQLEIVIVR